MFSIATGTFRIAIRRHFFASGHFRSASSFSSPSTGSGDQNNRQWLLRAKKECDITYADLAAKLKVNKVWLTTAMLGQHPIPESVAKKLIKLLKVKCSDAELKTLAAELAIIPENRGTHVVPGFRPVDPTVARLNEMISLYGGTIKELIREEFGDGIMSAIDCTLKLEKQMAGEESRVVITINGKYLQYKTDHDA